MGRKKMVKSLHTDFANRINGWHLYKDVLRKVNSKTNWESRPQPKATHQKHVQMRTNYEWTAWSKIWKVGFSCGSFVNVPGFQDVEFVTLLAQIQYHNRPCAHGVRICGNYPGASLWDPQVLCIETVSTCNFPRCTVCRQSCVLTFAVNLGLPVFSVFWIICSGPLKSNGFCSGFQKQGSLQKAPIFFQNHRWFGEFI